MSMPLLRALAAALLLAGCGATSGGPRPAQPPVNAIGPAELASSSAPDLMELIRTARPQWLPRQDPGGVDVYLRSSLLGGVLELRSFSPREVEMVEYLSAAQADFRFPDARGRPAIVVTPRRR